MGKIHGGENWLVRVQGNEHPPVHIHVLHPDGKALIYLDGRAINSGVPAPVLKQAQAWVAANHALIRKEWARMDNPVPRAVPVTSGTPAVKQKRPGAAPKTKRGKA